MMKGKASFSLFYDSDPPSLSLLSLSSSSSSAFLLRRSEETFYPSRACKSPSFSFLPCQKEDGEELRHNSVSLSSSSSSALSFPGGLHYSSNHRSEGPLNQQKAEERCIDSSLSSFHVMMGIYSRDVLPVLKRELLKAQRQRLLLEDRREGEQRQQEEEEGLRFDDMEDQV